MSNKLKLILCIISLIIGVLIISKSVNRVKPNAGEVVIEVPSVLIKSKVYYANTKYGFLINLPDSWQGYTIVENTWSGMSVGATEGNNYLSEIGPLVLVRHPLWTEKNPRQDIPVMVFTLDQWTNMQNDAFHIGAAPINPSELGRNNKYVFALPARYNFAYQTGFEEVDQIIQAKSFVGIPITEDPLEKFNSVTVNIGVGGENISDEKIYEYGAIPSMVRVGFPKKVEYKNGKYFLTIDLALWFSGDQATKATREDKYGNDVYNRYYLRNQTHILKTIEVSKDAIIYTIDPGSGLPKEPTNISSFSKLLSGDSTNGVGNVNSNVPFVFDLKNNILISAYQHYIP